MNIRSARQKRERGALFPAKWPTFSLSATYFFPASALLSFVFYLETVKTNQSENLVVLFAQRALQTQRLRRENSIVSIHGEDAEAELPLAVLCVLCCQL